MKKGKLEKTETHYHALLKASEYDFLDLIESPDGRITIKILDSRWRTKKETITLLEEIIDLIKEE